MYPNVSHGKGVFIRVYILGVPGYYLNILRGIRVPTRYILWGYPGTTGIYSAGTRLPTRIYSGGTRVLIQIYIGGTRVPSPYIL